MAVTIAAVAEPASARVRVTVEGGPAREALYVFRRDSAGAHVVRDTSAGTVVWPPIGPPIATNLIANGDLADVDADGAILGLVEGDAGRVTRDSEHPYPGGPGWSARIRWGHLTHPAVNRYPSTTAYPSGV